MARYNPRYFEDETSGSLLTRILTGILLALVVILIGGTAVALARNKDAVGSGYRKADPSPQKVINMSSKTDEHLSAFDKLGQLRVITKSPDESHTGSLLIVSPWFSYAAGDVALFEELSQKDMQEKSIITNYFGQYTRNELLNKGERIIKEDLCALINEQLVLGKIKNVYFEQYLFFE